LFFSSTIAEKKRSNTPLTKEEENTSASYEKQIKKRKLVFHPSLQVLIFHLFFSRLINEKQLTNQPTTPKEDKEFVSSLISSQKKRGKYGEWSFDFWEKNIKGLKCSYCCEPAGFD